MTATCFVRRLTIACATLLAAGSASWADPLGTAFTYQGQLKQGGIPADEPVTLVFTLWDALGAGNPPVGGTQIGDPVTVNLAASDIDDQGLFTVRVNERGEFGNTAFSGDARWMQISVNGSTLSPRQAITAAPYALALRLPVDELTSHNGDALRIRNTHDVSGVAARFTYDNAAALQGYGVVGESNVSAGVRGTASGTAAAVYGLTTGTGYAGVFDIQNPSNGNPAIWAVTNGTGPAMIGQGIIHSSIGGFKFPDGTIQSTAATGGGGFWSGNGLDIFNNNVGRVGIGLNNPAAKLEVTGVCLGINCADLLRLNALGDGTTETLRLTANSLNTAHTAGPGMVGPLHLNNESPAHVLLAEGGGSVGIGVYPPTQRLDVAGIIRSSSGGIMFPDNTVQTTAAAGGPGFWSSNGLQIYNNNGGTVGIGTSAPDSLAALHVRSNDNCINCDPTVMRLTTVGNDAGSWRADIVFDGGPFGSTIDATSGEFPTSSLFLNSESTGDVLLAGGGGNVGVGTDSPGARLEISDECLIGCDLLRLTQTFPSFDPLSLVLGGSTINTECASSRPLQLNNESPWDVTLAAGGGNVGIGTVSPDRTLEVEAQQATARLTSGLSLGGSVLELKNAMPPFLAARLGSIDFLNAADDAPGQIAYKLDGLWELAFRVGGEDQMEIRSDGTTRVKVLEITGADLAEKFPTTEQADAIKPGTVMEIDPDNAGKLRIARSAYNRRVAGVVSGAGDIPVGAILGNLPGSESAPAIALSGRVWVYCDASAHEIQPGDLLTTSDVHGHAMKVTDHSRAQGAVLGKAMSHLKQGEIGAVLVLVSLQ